MSLNKIGIKFHDNDFQNTCEGFLQLMLWTGQLSYDLTKDSIVELFNKSAPGIYWLCQNRLQYNSSPDWDPESYLRITTADVYLDKEVVEYLANKDSFFNCDFHVLDWNLQYIYTV